MKKALLGFGLALTMVLPALPQDKEQDRVENAGTVLKEILNAPDGIPQMFCASRSVDPIKTFQH